MNLKPDTIIRISLGLLAVLSLAIWYLLPVLSNKLFMFQNHDCQKYLSVAPTYMENSAAAPKEWTEISIGELVLKLPISRYKKIYGNDFFISFMSEDGSILINNIAESRETVDSKPEDIAKYPMIHFEERMAILKSLPDDISFFKSRSRNARSSDNQILKFIEIPKGGLGELRIVNSKVLKAICAISEKGDNCYNAFVDVYSHNDKMSFSIMLMQYKDKSILDADLRRVIAGIRMPDHPLDPATAKRDINSIASTYNRTRQSAPQTALPAL